MFVNHNLGGSPKRTNLAFKLCRLANARWNNQGHLGIRYMPTQILDDVAICDFVTDGMLYLEDMQNDLLRAGINPRWLEA